MVEQSQAVPAETSVKGNITHRRLLVEMAAIIVFGAVAGFVFGGARFGIGVLFGGALAFANYFWLKRSLAAIFEKAVSGEGTWLLPLRFISRYIAIGFVVLAVYFSGALSPVAVILGLAAFAFAVVVDGFVSIFRRNI